MNRWASLRWVAAGALTGALAACPCPDPGAGSSTLVDGRFKLIDSSDLPYSNVEVFLDGDELLVEMDDDDSHIVLVYEFVRSGDGD